MRHRSRARDRRHIDITIFAQSGTHARAGWGEGGREIHLARVARLLNKLFQR